MKCPSENCLQGFVSIISTAEVIRDWETGRSRGFGFVTFSNSSSVSEACDRLNDTVRI